MAKVVGYKRADFKPKDSDSEIKGINLFVTYKRNDVQGDACERLFVSDNRAGTYLPKVGDEVEIVYNRYGKVESIFLAPL